MATAVLREWEMNDTLVSMADDTKSTESTDSADRIRMIFDTEDVLRRAVRLRAAKAGVSHSDILNGLIRNHLSLEIEEAQEFINSAKRRRKS